LNILSPSGKNAENILELIHFNKHFIVEKPLALRLDHIDEILSECDKKRIKLFVVKQNRFNPPIKKLKEAINKGRFGEFVLGTVRVRWCRNQEYYDQKDWRGTWAYDGGVFTNQAGHHIDMLIWMMGEVESVFAKTATRLVNIETEDTGIATKISELAEIIKKTTKYSGEVVHDTMKPDATLKKTLNIDSKKIRTKSKIYNLRGCKRSYVIFYE